MRETLNRSHLRVRGESKLTAKPSADLLVALVLLL